MFSSLTHTCACVLNHFSHVQLFVTLCTVAQETPLSMGSSRQEYWSGLPCPPPGDLPDPGIKFALEAGSLLLSHWGSPPVAEVSFKIKSLTWPCLSDTISMYQINVSVSIAASFKFEFVLFWVTDL